MTRPTVLFIDDQRSARDLFMRLLDPARYSPAVAPGVTAALEFMETQRPDVVITDLRMPEIDGLTGLDRYLVIDPELPVIVVTAFGSVETAVEAMKRGAFDFIRKPFDPSELQIVIDRAIRHRALVRENARLRSEVARQEGTRDIIGKAPAMHAVMNLVSRVAPSTFPVLILGESGTGKDLFAERIHKLSQRADKPFVSLNCSAIPEHLLESELFGHEKGAFSGANQARPGFFAEADEGTLFLDEICDMSAALQPKLLRVLQSGEYYRVGSRRLSRTNVRVVCATNRRIEEMVEAGEFRQDLYYRINTLRIHLPPMRERTEDVPVLADFFLKRLEQRGAARKLRISPEAMGLLLRYKWPGNVRELEHTIEHASLVCDGDTIGPSDLPMEVRGGSPTTAPTIGKRYRDARADFDKQYFVRLLEETAGNVQSAAEIAGLHRSTLYEKLARLGLTPDREP